MSTRSLNKVILIGNLTRDPELRYTPTGTAVATFGMATNRSWTTENGEKKEETEFHRIVVWNKLAELCSQLLFKGRRVYIEGRLQTRSWTAQDGTQKQSTEIVASDMLILDNRQAPGETPAESGQESEISVEPVKETISSEKPEEKAALKEDKKEENKDNNEETANQENNTEAEINKEDIPF